MSTSTVRDDRRGEPRTAAVLSVDLASETKGGRLGVTRDLSATGLLIVTPSHFTKGDRLRIKVHSGSDTELDVCGRVTRVDENPVSSPELWRYRVGIELDKPLPVSLLDRPSDRPS
jgi:hypothetical protein